MFNHNFWTNKMFALITSHISLTQDQRHAKNMRRVFSKCHWHDVRIFQSEALGEYGMSLLLKWIFFFWHSSLAIHSIWNVFQFMCTKDFQFKELIIAHQTYQNIKSLNCNRQQRKYGSITFSAIISSHWYDCVYLQLQDCQLI